mmetsp:Transcript_20187/g.57811  ORF Transcript_20187/g.57811 Transcript_20187/m.57811 type:complete len:298 (+) Transcript_20187:2248-3141(+)
MALWPPPALREEDVDALAGDAPPVQGAAPRVAAPARRLGGDGAVWVELVAAPTAARLGPGAAARAAHAAGHAPCGGPLLPRRRVQQRGPEPAHGGRPRRRVSCGRGGGGGARVPRPADRALGVAAGRALLLHAHVRQHLCIRLRARTSVRGGGAWRRAGAAAGQRRSPNGDWLPHAWRRRAGRSDAAAAADRGAGAVRRGAPPALPLQHDRVRPRRVAQDAEPRPPVAAAVAGAVLPLAQQLPRNLARDQPLREPSRHARAGQPGRQPGPGPRLPQPVGVGRELSRRGCAAFGGTHK